MFVNGLGAVATGVTLVVVLVAKFTSGAWVSVLLIAGMMSAMLWVRRHYAQVARRNADFRAAANRKSWAADRHRADSIVVDDFAARDAVRADAFAGNSRRARGRGGRNQRIAGQLEAAGRGAGGEGRRNAARLW